MYPEGKDILVVDSETTRRLLCARVLADEGFAVVAVAEGFSALRAAANRRFALAIAAVGLPGTLDGATTVHHLRARQPWLKALFVGRAAGRPHLSNSERDEFIAAPFQRRELLGCAFELLQRGAPGRPGRNRTG